MQELLQEEGVVVVVVVEEVPYQLVEEEEVEVVLLVVGEEEVVVADIQYLLPVVEYFEHPHLQPVDEKEKTRIMYANASKKIYSRSPTGTQSMDISSLSYALEHQG